MNEELIFEVLCPRDVYILCREDDYVIYVTNEDGTALLKKAYLEE